MTADVQKTVEEKIKGWGIPVSDFIEDVEKFLTEKFKKAEDTDIGTDQAENCLRSMDDLLEKYKMFEAGLGEKGTFLPLQNQVLSIILRIFFTSPPSTLSCATREGSNCSSNVVEEPQYLQMVSP